MQFITVKTEKPNDSNFILGQTHFIKSVEDIHKPWSPPCGNTGCV
jgi:adenosine/AMP kinase